MEDYKDIREFLKPRRDIKASESLHTKIHAVLYKEHKKRHFQTWIYGGISLSAVAAILLLVFIPSGMSAKHLLSQVIKALGDTESLEMVAEIRSRPVENFRYIDLDENFVRHQFEIVENDSVLKWRINKGGRIAMSNGNEIYTWIPDLGVGWRIDNANNENVLGFLANLLNPRKILEMELKNCKENNKSKYKVKQNGEEIILTIQTPAQGTFENPYLLNKSITESENKRLYVIDATTNRLKRVTVSVISGKREIEVVKVDSINYSIGDKIFIPDKRIKFIEIENNQSGGLTGFNAEEAASIILNALENWDENILNQVMAPEIWENLHREKFQGSKLISIGTSFTSGIGNSIFVPYTLALPEGSVQRHNIALQQTDSGGWIISGGL